MSELAILKLKMTGLCVFAALCLTAWWDLLTPETWWKFGVAEVGFLLIGIGLGSEWLFSAIVGRK